MGIVDRAEQPGLVTTTLDKVLRWGRSRSLWPVQAGIACCSLEMMTTGSARYDFDRFGIMFRSSPRQSDVLIVPGPITKKMEPIILRVYHQIQARSRSRSHRVLNHASGGILRDPAAGGCFDGAAWIR